MSSRNNPISAVQKKRTASTTPKKRTVSSSRPSRAPKKAPVKQHYSMPGWLRNILAVAIVGCFSMVFYYFFIRPYAYRWKPCNGLKEYGVCIPSGYDIHGIDISHYQGKIDWGRLLQNKQTATPLHFIFMKATEGGDHNDTLLAGRALACFDGNLMGRGEYIGQMIDAALEIREIRQVSKTKRTFEIANKSDPRFAVRPASYDYPMPVYAGQVLRIDITQGEEVEFTNCILGKGRYYTRIFWE